MAQVFEYREPGGGHIKLTKFGPDDYSVWVPATRRYWKHVTANKAFAALASLGVDPRQPGKVKARPARPLPVSRPQAPPSREPESRKPETAPSRPKSRRVPHITTDWYRSEDYRKYCADIGADPEIARRALNAGTFSGPVPQRKRGR